MTTTFSWNGFSLTNNTLGWRVLNEGSLGLNISYAYPANTIANTHGVIFQRGYAEASTYRLVIATKTSGLNQLLGLFQRQFGNTFGYNSLVADNAQVIGINPSREGVGADPWRKVEITIQIPGVWLRTSTPATYSATALASGSSLNVFPDLAGAISDAQIIIEVSGVTSPSITDVGTGTRWRLNGARTGIFRFDSSTRRAFEVATTSSWTGGTVLDPTTHTPPPNRGIGFEISPVTIIETGQPRSYGQVQFTGSGGTANLFVRGRNAHTI